MDVQSVVTLAKKHVGELFAEEGVINLGLEEVTYNEQEKVWNVTVGFSRPWDKPIDVSQTNPLGAIARMQTARSTHHRDYKIVRIKDYDGKILALTSREFET